MSKGRVSGEKYTREKRRTAKRKMSRKTGDPTQIQGCEGEIEGTKKKGKKRGRFSEKRGRGQETTQRPDLIRTALIT